ncbi:MAG: hypothetical protein MUD01_17345 [Chloroflexaceae bacterium]|nr:hypothetical protein [Chloroflexaceae bacterium]
MTQIILCSHLRHLRHLRMQKGIVEGMKMRVLIAQHGHFGPPRGDAASSTK